MGWSVLQSPTRTNIISLQRWLADRHGVIPAPTKMLSLYIFPTITKSSLRIGLNLQVCSRERTSNWASSVQQHYHMQVINSSGREQRFLHSKTFARTKKKARYLHHDLGTTSLYDWFIAILIWVDPRARLAPYSSHGQSLLWMTTWNSKEAHTKEDISMAFPPNTWSQLCGLVQVFRVYTLIGFSTITTRVHCDNEFRPCHWSIEKSIRVIKEVRVRAA